MAAVDIKDFDYRLPKERIAQTLLHPRDHCKLLVLNDSVEHRRFTDVVDCLHPGDVLVINQTKVSHAKLLGRKESGGKIEVVLTKHLLDKTYECRIKGARVVEGSTLIFQGTSAKVISRKDDIFTLSFTLAIPTNDLILVTPPYIKQTVPEDDYQTIFAREEGSLAAPTASLHFTPELVETILAKGVKIAYITLHIGFGTFIPVRDLNNHRMDPEFYEISSQNARIMNAATRVIAVGTTTVKALESASSNGVVHPKKEWSKIFIKPGHAFSSSIAAMITNFHLPQSSLLLLVCAFAGTKRVLHAYHEAIARDYRFYSLGDAMFVTRESVVKGH